MTGVRRRVGPPSYALAFPRHGIATSGECTWEGPSPDGAILCRQRGYHLDDAAYVYALLRRMPAELADLVDVAFGAYVLDRLSPRRHAGAPSGSWHRTFRLQVPVRDLDRWHAESTREGLECLLSDLTDDAWTIEPIARTGSRRTAEAQEVLLTVPQDLPLALCLFSGGLDSLNGAVSQLMADKAVRLLCVGGTTSSWLGTRQEELIGAVGRHFGGRASSLLVAFDLAVPHVPWSEEPTQRTRGFIHLVLGAVAAVMAGVDRLSVHENGVGALNLPYTAAQHGAQMTRATHPLMLAEMSAWLSRYLGRSFQVVGSSLGVTKAQATRILAEAGLGRLVPRTFSCDGFQRVAGRPQCGVCPSCLLRRQALHTAGLARFDDAGRYRFDVTDQTCRLPAVHKVGIALMQDQLDVLRRCLGTESPWPALVNAFPVLWEVEQREAEWRAAGGPGDLATTLVGMYRAYVEEWETFPLAPALRPGHAVRTNLPLALEGA